MRTKRNTLNTKKFTNTSHVFHEYGQRAVNRMFIAIVLDNMWMMQLCQYPQLCLQCLKHLAIVKITVYFILCYLTLKHPPLQ